MGTTGGAARECRPGRAGVSSLLGTTAAMAVAFSLWETRSGNIVSAHETEAAALAAVRETIRVHGRTAVASLVLARETTRSTRIIAAGDALADRTLMTEQDTTDRSAAST